MEGVVGALVMALRKVGWVNRGAAKCGGGGCGLLDAMQ